MNNPVNQNIFSGDVKGCPICHSSAITLILNIPQIPILSNVIWEKREDALSAPRGDMELAFCQNCKHVFNQVFNPALMEYNIQYENSLHFSPLFQDYANGLAHYLMDQYDLHDKTIIEIGSGKGDFLRLLCKEGQNQGVGFDPSYQLTSQENDPSLTFVNDIYNERYANFQADLILSRHVLEHIYKPTEMIQGLRRTIGASKHTTIFFEVPNLDYILRDIAIWDIIYEHYSYFSAISLANLFTRSGFKIRNVADAYNSQFLYIEAIPAADDQPLANASQPDTADAMNVQVRDFSKRSQEKIERWKTKMNELHKDGRRVVLWGAGSKGISFLNMLNIRDEVKYVVDINPRKQGKYITGTGQQIIPPGDLQSCRPDTVIIMNPIYQQEIQRMAAQHGLNINFLLAN